MLALPYPASEAFEQAQIAFDEGQAARLANDKEALAKARERHRYWTETFGALTKDEG